MQEMNLLVDFSLRTASSRNEFPKISAVSNCKLFSSRYVIPRGKWRRWNVWSSIVPDSEDPRRWSNTQCVPRLRCYRDRARSLLESRRFLPHKSPAGPRHRGVSSLPVQPRNLRHHFPHRAGTRQIASGISALPIYDRTFQAQGSVPVCPRYFDNYYDYFSASFAPLPFGPFPVCQLTSSRLLPRAALAHNPSAVSKVIQNTVKDGNSIWDALH